jgi:hypothetical protein
MLVLLPTAAGARLVAAYLRSGTGNGLGDNIPLDIEPAVLLLFKPCPFMVNVFKSVQFISGLKFHDPRGILTAALDAGEYFEPQPPGLFTPVPGLLDINLILAVFATGIHNISNGVGYIGRIPASHKGFRRGRET